MSRRLQKFLLAALFVFIPFRAFAQPSGSTSTRSAQSPDPTAENTLATPAGNDVHF